MYKPSSCWNKVSFWLFLYSQFQIECKSHHVQCWAHLHLQSASSSFHIFFSIFFHFYLSLSLFFCFPVVNLIWFSRKDSDWRSKRNWENSDERKSFSFLLFSQLNGNNSLKVIIWTDSSHYCTLHDDPHRLSEYLTQIS